jgi:hypothetical protein
MDSRRCPMRRAAFKVISPVPAAPAKVRKPKAAPRHIEHVRYGMGRVLAVRQIDGTDDGYMADVRFADGITRTLLLVQRVWISDIAGLIPEPPKPRLAQIKAEPVEEIRPDGLDGAASPTLEAAA